MVSVLLLIIVFEVLWRIETSLFMKCIDILFMLAVGLHLVFLSVALWAFRQAILDAILCVRCLVTMLLSVLVIRGVRNGCMLARLLCLKVARTTLQVRCVFVRNGLIVKLGLVRRTVASVVVVGDLVGVRLSMLSFLLTLGVVVVGWFRIGIIGCGGLNLLCAFRIPCNCRTRKMVTVVRMRTRSTGPDTRFVFSARCVGPFDHAGSGVW